MAKNKSLLSAPSKAIDPALAALFSESAGAIKAPPKSRYTELLSKKPNTALEDEDEDENDVSGDEAEDSDEESIEEPNRESDPESLDYEEEASSGDEGSEAGCISDTSDLDEEAEAADVLEAIVSHGTSRDEGRKRKRKQHENDEDLETKYLGRLANEEPSGKRRKGDLSEQASAAERENDGVEEDDAGKEGDESSGNDVPVHESLSIDPAVSELEKANRTIFLSNVSIEAITSRKAKKMLLNHLASILDRKADPPQKVESIRFRSTAFSTSAIPKRAAYIKKSLLEATTKSTNAYVVYSTTAAARLAVAHLNGSMILDRHLRVDSVAHPSPVDHRRCVFIGNLGFVDDETVLNVKVDEEGKQVTEKRKRTKTPMDVEEGLWRVFSREAGKVESVRVVRDATTRVGKGIAYVQFYDANDVESAILLNGKKFPPMLPRELRVSRCKAPHKTARAMEARQGKAGSPGDRKENRKKAKNRDSTDEYVPKLTAEAQTLAGRASKLLGRFGAAQLVRKGQTVEKRDKKRERDSERNHHGRHDGAPAGGGEKSIKPPEDFVFEGRRASARDGKPKDLKFKGRSGKDKAHKKSKAKSRGAVRAAKWRATQKGGGGSGSK
ncbi:Nucleolar protein 12 [Madurella mycetomatis]|uniref:Nucleolar protein 12 n=1 Tax=Madurella mycetomatis TaxID=100816 RepID=A0A175W119_9PEZI|nr:Nucleolar protein 12 [Madurella mycetomatis]